MIKLKQVSKTFDTKSGNLHAVKDVNLEIDVYKRQIYC